MIKLIVFDWDDVFTIGSKEGYFACYRKALEAVNITLPEKEFKDRIIQAWGQSARKELENLLREHPQLVETALETYTKALRRNTFIQEIKLLPGVNELLLRLKQKYILALATGVNPQNLKIIMKRFAVPEVFSEIIFATELEDQSLAKPSGYMVTEILRRTKIKPQEAIVVGDAANDILMGRNAGVLALAVLTGHLNRQQAEELKVPYILNVVTEIETVLETL